MANETFISKGTALLVNGEVGADHAFSVEGLADQAGRVSIQIDLGVAPRRAWFAWSMECQWQATPTQGGTLDLYIAGAPDGDSTQIDGDVGATDAALGDIDMRRNLTYIGSVVSENATAGEKSVASGRFFHTERYITFVVFNDGGAAINATDSNFRLDIQPMAWQGQ